LHIHTSFFNENTMCF